MRQWIASPGTKVLASSVAVGIIRPCRKKFCLAADRKREGRLVTAFSYCFSQQCLMAQSSCPYRGGLGVVTGKVASAWQPTTLVPVVVKATLARA